MRLTWSMPALAVAGLIGAVAVWARLGSVPSPDVAWLLYATDRLLAGARLGVDIADATPPVILWLQAPAVLVARSLDISLWPTWACAVALLAAASVWLCGRVLRRLPDWQDRDHRRGFLGLVLLVLLVLPGQDFGQREHVALILILPYLLLAAARLEAAPAPAGLEVVAGMLAGTGMSIKPHFALLFTVLVLHAALRRGGAGRRALRQPEHVAAGLAGLSCVTAVLLLAPEWVSYAVAHWPLYSTFLSIHPLLAAVAGPGAAVSFLALLSWVALRGSVVSRRPTIDALLLGTVAFHSVASIQGKGFEYHYLPAFACGLLTLAVIYTGTWRPLPGLARPLYAAAGGAAIAAALVLGAWNALGHAGRALSGRGDVDATLHALTERVLQQGPSPTIAGLSTSIATGFPLVLQTGATWSSRHSALWMLTALYEDRIFRGTVVAPRATAQQPAAERAMLDELHEDLANRPPDLIIVMTPDPFNMGFAGARHFDYLAYLEAEPRFRRLLSRYTTRAFVGPYLLLSPGMPEDPLEGAGPAPVPSSQPTGPVSPAVGLKVLRPAVVLVLALFVLALVREIRSRHESP